jgi:hypothetical protein
MVARGFGEILKVAGSRRVGSEHADGLAAIQDHQRLTGPDERHRARQAAGVDQCVITPGLQGGGSFRGREAALGWHEGTRHRKIS